MSQTVTQNCANEGGGLFANILTCEQKWKTRKFQKTKIANSSSLVAGDI
jgi:hypothetical protein